VAGFFLLHLSALIPLSCYGSLFVIGSTGVLCDVCGVSRACGGNEPNVFASALIIVSTEPLAVVQANDAYSRLNVSVSGHSHGGYQIGELG
jgi:hypothetical protein